jgi:hypothetical protein
MARAFACAATVAVSALGASGSAMAQPVKARGATDTGTLKVVNYRGYSFQVPRTWPVIDNARRPNGCVRFDQHAVYLGAVSGDQSCPSWLLGTTESLLIQPGPSGVTPFSAEDQVARSVTARAPGIVVTATFGTDPALIAKILTSAGLPAPVLTGTAQAASGGQARHVDGSAVSARIGAGASPAMHGTMPSPPLPAAVANYRGRGFDSCSAPSRRTMRAWRRHSHFRAIGIYIGGSDRACAQPNLSRSWVRYEASAGWRFIPLYAGPQAAFGELRHPGKQGRAAGRDAVAHARRLGFGRHTPIYYDMEAYGPSSRRHAMRFLLAWIGVVHRLGYSAGVYSSSDSGIADLSHLYRRHVFPRPDVIYDALWNGKANTRDRNFRKGQWYLRRIHQYRGNVTQRHGGRRINIDLDFLQVRLNVLTAATPQSTSAVAQTGGAVNLFYRSHGILYLERYSPKGGWARPRRTGLRPASAPSVVSVGSSSEVFYKDSSGHLQAVTFASSGKRTGQLTLTQMGVLGSGPRAVESRDGVIDVFWHGSADDHLWHAEYLPGSGWFGPQGLGGALGSYPAPVISSPGTTSVLWKGKDASLWCVSRGIAGQWSAPRKLGMGPLGGQPEATAEPNGGIQVYWHGAGHSLVWEAFYRPGVGWLGPRDLGGDVRSKPWPSSTSQAVRVLWRGPGNELNYIRHRPVRKWNASQWQGPAQVRPSWLGASPFTAIGPPPLRVFWTGHHNRLWTTSLGPHGWTRPVPLG